ALGPPVDGPGGADPGPGGDPAVGDTRAVRPVPVAGAQRPGEAPAPHHRPTGGRSGPAGCAVVPGPAVRPGGGQRGREPRGGPARPPAGGPADRGLEVPPAGEPVRPAAAVRWVRTAAGEGRPAAPTARGGPARRRVEYDRRVVRRPVAVGPAGRRGGA